MQISILILLFSDQISGRDQKLSRGITASGRRPLPPSRGRKPGMEAGGDKAFQSFHNLPNKHITAAAYLAVAFINIVGNIFLPYTLWKTKQLGRLSSKLIVCLSVSDWCIGFVIQHINISIILTRHQSCTLEVISGFSVILSVSFLGSW